jgi:mannose-6-phosphate isomerase-like protein (cupin superfamily)
VLAGRDQGLTCVAGFSMLQPGAGALHAHKDADEVFIVIEGTLDFRLGDERFQVNADHTIAIPAGIPHSFVAVGPGPVRMYTFMPASGAIAGATVYFEGSPPTGSSQH